MIPAEPTTTGYAILAIGIACYIALALIWHWAFCKSLENDDEAERRTQFCRSMQAKADQEKIEEWKDCREAAKRSSWNNVTEPTFQMKFDKERFKEVEKSMNAAIEKAHSGLSQAGLWGNLGNAYGMSHARCAASFPYVLSAPTTSLMPGEYINPFHFLDEFDQWFEFQSRKRFYKERTQDIIKDMLKNDIERARKAYDASNYGLKLDVMCDFGAQILSPRAVFINPDFT